MRKLIWILSLTFTLSAVAEDVMLMNRIGPSKSALNVANSDVSGEHKLLSTSGFDYHASYSYDGKWIDSSRAAEYLIEMESVEKMVRHADSWAGPLNDTGHWARIGKTTQRPGSS